MDLIDRAQHAHDHARRMEDGPGRAQAAGDPPSSRRILNEIARCPNMPFNIAAYNSSATTTPRAAGPQTYFKSIRVDRPSRLRVLDRALAA